MGKRTNGRKVFIRFVLQIKLCLLHGYVMKRHPPLPGKGEGDTFTKGNVCLAFRQKGGGQRAQNKDFFLKVYLHGEQGC